MTSSDDLVKQSIEELQDLVRCRCHEAYSGRGLQDPECDCDSAEAVGVVADRIKALQPVGEALEACPDVMVGDVVEMIHARQRELEQEPECDT